MQVEPRQYLGPRGVHRVMENKDGLHLQSYFWPAAEAKAVVLFVHGHGAHLMFEILNQTVGARHGFVQAVQHWGTAGLPACLGCAGCSRACWLGAAGGLAGCKGALPACPSAPPTATVLNGGCLQFPFT